MAVAPLSLKVMLLKFAAGPPSCLARMMFVPSGACRCTYRFPTPGKRMFTVTFRSAMGPLWVKLSCETPAPLVGIAAVVFEVNEVVEVSGGLSEEVLTGG